MKYGLFMLGSMVLLAACDAESTIPADGGGTDGGAMSDSGSGDVDSGSAVDSGTRTDAGSTTDGGPGPGDDAGPGADAGSSADGGSSSTDAGTAGDASAPDAGPAPDGGPMSCMDAPTTEGRPTAPVCTACRPPGPGTSSGTGACRADADCTDGVNGRCLFGRIGSYCNYDECFEDSDCASGELCACDIGPGSQNLCITAGCTTNADCGGYDCSSSLGGCGNYAPPAGYFCHGPADSGSGRCRSNEDCTRGEDCRYEPTSGIWACSGVHCVG